MFHTDWYPSWSWLCEMMIRKQIKTLDISMLYSSIFLCQKLRILSFCRLRIASISTCSYPSKELRNQKSNKTLVRIWFRVCVCAKLSRTRAILMKVVHVRLIPVHSLESAMTRFRWTKCQIKTIQRRFSLAILFHNRNRHNVTDKHSVLTGSWRPYK